jgi:membrane protease subunit HflK
VSSRSQLLAKALGRADVGAGLALALAAAWIASGVYTVPPTSVAVTRTFGSVADARVPPGIHWWWPSPLGRVDRVEVMRTFSLSLGIKPAADGRPEMSDPVESRWLTGDTNILQLRSKVSWGIADPARFLLGIERPERVLRLAVGAAFTAAASRLPVDELLTSGRFVLRQGVREHAQAMLDGWRTGVRLLAVEIQVVEPPAVVLAAFQEVQNARADRERLVSEAEGYANTSIPLARGEAEKTIGEALGFREKRVGTAQGDAARFVGLAVEHHRSPALLERRLYLETAERVLPRVKRYVLEPGGDASMPIRLLE